MPAAQDEHDERAEQDECAEQRADTHRGVQNLPHLSHDARGGVEPPVKYIKPLHERNSHQNHRQDKGELDPAENVELEEVARVRKRPREI